MTVGTSRASHYTGEAPGTISPSPASTGGVAVGTIVGAAVGGAVGLALVVLAGKFMVVGGALGA